MLDVKFIRDNTHKVKEAVKNKQLKVDIDKLLELDEKRRELLQEVEKFKAQKNEASKKIATLEGDDKQSAIDEMKKVGDKESKAEKKLDKVLGEYNELMLLVPMVPSDETPVGKDDADNVEIKVVGEKPKFDFQPKDHMQLGTELDIIDIERAVKVGGSRSYVLKGDGARLEMALLKYGADFINRRGYTQMNVPVMVNEFAMTGTGWFPHGRDEVYELKNDNKFLVGTSEVSIGGFHANEILPGERLPIKYSGYSACYRREAGSYGKDTHGLYRVHQFNKVEQFIFCENNDATSQEMFEELVTNVEEFLQSLHLPYRILNVCTGDMGQGKYFMYDLECWMPSREGYGETHSCSNLHDFQARRLNIRYKDSEGKTHFPHTLNNTLIATPRILIPILENNQQADGSILIPEVLRPYMDNQESIEKK